MLFEHARHALSPAGRVIGGHQCPVDVPVLVSFPVTSCLGDQVESTHRLAEATFSTVTAHSTSRPKQRGARAPSRCFRFFLSFFPLFLLRRIYLFCFRLVYLFIYLFFLIMSCYFLFYSGALDRVGFLYVCVLFCLFCLCLSVVAPARARLLDVTNPGV